MKKFLISAVAALAMTAGFSSCSEDRDPVYQQPTEFVVNEPVAQNQYIALDKASDEATISLVCSQPNYGYSAVAIYGAQVSLSPEFKDKEDGTPDNYVSIESTGTGTQSSMLLSQYEIACAMTTLNGWDDDNHPEDAAMDYQKLYLRATCQLNGVEGSFITSNVVALNYVRPYFAVKKPGFIYLVGAPSGWNVDATPENLANMEKWKLYEPEDGINQKIYVGDFDMPAAPVFRFYTQLGSWDPEFSIGHQVDDNATAFPEYTGNGSWSGSLVTDGKGSWEFPNYTGGHMYIKVDVKGKKLYIQDHSF